MEFPVFEIAQSWCKALADQDQQPEDMVAGATGIGKMLLDIEDRILVEQRVGAPCGKYPR